MTKRILLIDDEPEFVDPQIEALQEAGYNVTLETESDAVIALLQKQGFDLIILDLILPPRRENREGRDEQELDFAETGVKLHQEIRERLGLTDIPIVFLTVVRDQDILHGIRRQERKYKQGSRVLMKPCRPSDVVAEVRRALGDPENPSL